MNPTKVPITSNVEHGMSLINRPYFQVLELLCIWFYEGFCKVCLRALLMGFGESFGVDSHHCFVPSLLFSLADTLLPSPVDVAQLGEMNHVNSCVLSLYFLFFFRC